MCAYNTKNLHSGYFHNFWWASQGHPKNDPKWRHQWDLLAKYVGKLEQMARWPAKHGGTYGTWFSKVDLFISTLLTITSKSWGPRSRKWQPIVTRTISEFYAQFSLQILAVKRESKYCGDTLKSGCFPRNRRN